MNQTIKFSFNFNISYFCCSLIFLKQLFYLPDKTCWLSIDWRIKHKFLSLAFKIHINFSPKFLSYLQELIFHYIPFFFFFNFRGGLGRERERERNINVRETLIICLPYTQGQGWIHNLSMCPDQELNPQSQFTGPMLQTTEQHWREWDMRRES